jgi:hypothetical protein
MTGGTHKSATQAGDAAAAERERARELGRLLRLGLGPGGEGGRGEEMGCRAESEEKGNFFFFFLFNYFKAFSNDFGIKFEFESNHSSQKFKCNSMSAQACFYSYI